MNEFHLAIQLQDEALARALARAIAKEYPYVRAVIGESEGADFTIRDDFLGAPAPVREILDRAMAASGKEFSFARKPESCPMTAFTAGGGGRGVSSCAGLYAAHRARERKAILLLCFDPYAPVTDPSAGMDLLRRVTKGGVYPLKTACVQGPDDVYRPAQSTVRNLLHELTAEDAAILLQNAEDSGEWDEVVLDVPRAYGNWREILNMCERNVAVFGERGFGAEADEAAFAELKSLSAVGTDRSSGPSVYRFQPGLDMEMTGIDTDLHSALGCEVKELAQQLAGG